MDKDQSVSVASPASASSSSMDPSKLLNLMKGLDRVSSLKRNPDSLQSSDISLEDKKPNLDLKPEVPKMDPNVTSGYYGDRFLNGLPPIQKLEPNPNYPEMVYLQQDDPRSLLVAQHYPPIKQVTSMDLPEQPTNLFLTVNGKVAMPLLSVQYYRAIAPPPSPPPVYPDSDEYLDEEEEDEEPLVQETSSKSKSKDEIKTNASKSAPICRNCGEAFETRSQLSSHLAKSCKEKPFLCEICGARFTWKNSLRSHERLLHGKLTPRMKKMADSRLNKLSK